MDGGAISRLRCTNEKGIFEGPSVDKQLGPAAGGLSVTGSLNESVHLKRPRGVADRDQGPRQVASPHRSQTLGRILIRRNRQTAGAIDVELETGVRVGQGECSYHFVSGSGFAGNRAKKFPAGRSVVEQSADLNCGALLPGH